MGNVTLIAGVTPLHALHHTDVECHFVKWSSLLIVLAVSILGWSELAVDDTGVVVQSYPTYAQVETDLVLINTRVFKRCHKISIELRSGLFPGQDNNSVILDRYHYFNYFNVWQGAESC
ncbi:hypothetical protein TNCV_1092471 [Trichonephila clavipes]|nr:hypothetical protein TNCV_1092471 [Trichonephila clavipes]